MKHAAIALVVFAATFAAFAQSPPPETPPPTQPAQPTQPTPAPVPPPPPPPPPVPPEPAAPPAAPKPQRLFIGGGVGLSFGTVDLVEISPILTYRVLPRLDLGTGVFYRYRSDDRYEPSFEANDYGASVFAQVWTVRNLFLQAEYSYENYEYPLTEGGTERTGYNSFLAGVGFSQSMGRGAGMYASVLYNFNYDENDLLNPYSSPWVYRVGFGVGF